MQDHMQCFNCGHVIPRTVSYCPYCQANVKASHRLLFKVRRVLISALRRVSFGGRRIIRWSKVLLVPLGLILLGGMAAGSFELWVGNHIYPNVRLATANVDVGGGTRT